MKVWRCDGVGNKKQKVQCVNSTEITSYLNTANIKISYYSIEELVEMENHEKEKPVTVRKVHPFKVTLGNLEKH